MFIIMALTQVLGVGTVALIAHAVGRKDQADANLIFNQSLLIAALCGVLTLVIGYTGSAAYVRSIAADEATVEAGVSYLYWFMPGMALQFAMVAMGSALRGTGIVKPTMVVQVLTLRDQHDPRADSHRGLGHRPSDGRCRRRAREHPRDRRRV